MKAPHEVRRPNRRYIGSTDEVIEKLREDGQDVSWYAKYKQTDRLMEAEKCGYFTVYLLEGDWAYTIDSTGEKYLEYRKLTKPEPKPCYFCSACKERISDRELALAHRNIRQLDN
jgi:hypothetical protein